jgi:hypothetical protein
MKSTPEPEIEEFISLFHLLGNSLLFFNHFALPNDSNKERGG